MTLTINLLILRIRTLKCRLEIKLLKAQNIYECSFYDSALRCKKTCLLALKIYC